MDLGGFLPSVMAAGVLGILTGLGIGGGSLLILWLTLAVRMEPAQARAVSLLAFFPASLISARFTREKTDMRILLPAAVSGCCSALGFSLVARILDPEQYRSLLGLLLVGLGLREILFRKKKGDG